MNGLSDIPQKISLIKQIPLFSRFNWLELTAIARKSMILEYKKGDIICREDTLGDGFYGLVSGRLQAYHLSSSGKKENVELIFRGMYFGVVSIFTGENHSLMVEALNDSTIIKIPRDEFLSILKSIPSLWIDLTQRLSQRIRSKATPTSPSLERAIIAIYSPVKGSGSSTYAINLALSLRRETKRRVIFVHIGSSRSQEPRTTASQAGLPVVRDESIVPTVVAEASPQWKKPGINLPELLRDPGKIPQHIITEFNLDMLNVNFDPNDRMVTGQISEFVSILVHQYDYVVVDLPNDMDDVVLQTLIQSDLVYLIALPREKDLRLTRSVIDDIQKKLKDKFSKENVQILISSLDPKSELSREETQKILDYNFSSILPFINHSELSKAIVSEAMTVITPDEQSRYSKVVKVIARRIGGVLVGLVLGGGAALGIAHIGVIRILERENIPIDMVVGSSMGAVIAGLWAIGNNADQIETIAREFEKKYRSLVLFDPVFPKTGFIGGRFIKRWLKKHLGDTTFAETKIPLKITVYDLIHREEHILEEGSLVEAVRESIAIPGVIEPVMKGGRMSIDGGVLNPLPTNVLNRLGIRKIIAVNVLQSPADVSRGYELAKSRLQEDRKIPFFRAPLKFLWVRSQKIFSTNIPDIIIRTLQATGYVIAEQSAKQADVVIHPELVGINWFELYEVDRLIKSGEQAALEHLTEIKKLVMES